MEEPNILLKLHRAASDALEWLAAGAIASVLTYFKMRKTVSGDQLQTNENNAASGIINQLRTEISRMAAQNAQLATMLNDLQLEVIDLRNENSALKTAVEELKRGQQNS